MRTFPSSNRSVAWSVVWPVLERQSSPHRAAIWTRPNRGSFIALLATMCQSLACSEAELSLRVAFSQSSTEAADYDFLEVTARVG